MTQFASDSCPSGPQPLPPARISAGMEASMMTSEDTCRLVMPLSLSTIYRGGRAAMQLLMSARISALSLTRSSKSPRAEIGVHAERGKRGAMGFEYRSEESFDGMSENDGIRDLHHG